MPSGLCLCYLLLVLLAEWVLTVLCMHPNPTPQREPILHKNKNSKVDQFTTKTSARGEVYY